MISNRSLNLCANKSVKKSKKKSVIERLEPRVLLTTDLLITEFQALNRSTIQDSDGDFSDWIEVSNTGNQSIDLTGWYLTDDENDLNKWQFPNGILNAGEHLLVFASGKNRDSGDQFHTNFRLSGDGEFLALVEPDGETIAHSYTPSFPPQLEDQSYGLAPQRDATPLVENTSEVSVLVPQDDRLGIDWTLPNFDDQTWRHGSAGVGFENLRPLTTIREDFSGPLGPEWTVDITNDPNATVEAVEGGLRFSASGGADTTSLERGNAPIVYRDIPIENVAEWELIAQIEKETAGDRGSVGLMIFDGATTRPALMLEQSTSRQFTLVSGTTEFSESIRQTGTFFLRIQRNEIERTWSASAKVEATDDWTHIATVTDGTFEGPVVSDPKIALFARAPVGSVTATVLSAEFIAAPQQPVYGPLIGVDVGAEMSNQNASTYIRYPFQIEGDPEQFDVLSLGARFDDGFRAYLNGSLIASRNDPVVASWNAASTMEHGARLNQIPLEQFDVTDALSHLQSGDNVLAIHGMNASAADPDFFVQIGLVASDVSTTDVTFFQSPTPGQQNAIPSAPAPKLVGADGIFVDSTSIELTLDGNVPESFEIRYTLDGTEPTVDSNLYTAPIEIATSAMLQARTFDTLLAPNFEPSSITSKTFVAIANPLQDRASNMPLVVIDTLGAEIPHTNSNDLRKVSISVMDVDRSSGTSSLTSELVEYLGRAGVRRRGSSTGAQAKPQLALEIWGPNGTNRNDDFDVNLFGMSSDSDWVLHAPFGGDPAFMRNRIGFELSNQMGRWAPDTQFVEVYINTENGLVTEDDYMGVYVLMEKIKPGADRLDIQRVNTSDNLEPAVTGGYIWKVDRPDPDAPGFPAGNGVLNWVYPESPLSQTAPDARKATAAQQEWTTEFWAQFQRSLQRPDINDPDGYARYIDVDAWIDYHMMQVVMYNADALGLSIFYHKDREGKLAAGPLWDLNLTAESTRIDDDDPSLWTTGANFFNAAWWNDLFRDPGFWQRYVDRWHAHRQTVLSDENIGELLTRLGNEVGESADRNAVRWPDNSFRDLSGFNSGFLDGTFQGEVEHIRIWMQERTRFLDETFTGAAQLAIDGTTLGDVPGALISPNQEVEILSAPIAAFEDVKIVSGVPGETIARYFVPTDNELGDSWTTLEFDDSSWESGPTGLGMQRNEEFADLLGTEVNPRLVHEDATNILSRIQFEVSDLASMDDHSLVLRLKFEDGYAAYINGVRVSRDNLQSNDPTWDARGVNRRVDDALEFTDVDISRYRHLLNEGTENVLSIRVLNSSPSSREMIIVPELVFRKHTVQRRAEAIVYYTTDGSDPRGLDGNPNPNAIAATSGDTFSVSENTRIIARNFDATDRGPEAVVVRTDWGAPVQYDFLVDPSPIIISEINFNPAALTEEEQTATPDANNDGRLDWTNEDFEFVEMYNPTDTDVSLIGTRLSGAVQFDFANGDATSIAGGGYGLVVNNREAFALRYGAELPILGEFTGNLSNDGERLELVSGNQETLFSVGYRDSGLWPIRADGFGASLELVDPSIAVELQSKSYSWRGSAEFHGSPGRAGMDSRGVVVNEILAHTEAPIEQVDAIELFNSTDESIDLGGWFLSDSGDNFQKYQIPDGTTIDAGAYLVFDESHFNSEQANEDGFALNGEVGESVWLTMVDPQSNVLRFVDDVHFRGSKNGESLARFPNADGSLTPALENTLGMMNLSPRIGPVVISEIHYNPGPPTDADRDLDANISSSDLEFIEIVNPTDDQIDLSNWRIRGGVDFEFSDGTTLESGQTLVVVGFNPENPENRNRLAAFRSHYQLTDDAQVIGGFGGRLSNSQDRVELLRAEPSPAGRPEFIPYVLEDEVRYDDRTPWPANADGTGDSLHRSRLDGFGGAGENWSAAEPTPGVAGVTVNADFNGDTQINHVDIDLLFAAIRDETNDRRFDLTGDGKVDLEDRNELVQGILGTEFGDSNLDGVFDSADLIMAFDSGEYEDEVMGNSGWADGDWNGDGEFTSRDLVLAFQLIKPE